jgi:hypothetical protein
MGANMIYEEKPFEHMFPTPEKYGYDSVAKVLTHLLSNV